MPLQAHVAELSRRHRLLEKQIDEEKSHPALDLNRVSELKRKKLQLKDELARLQH